MPTLTGRVALVTGASSGIGRATAVELARQGARVVVNYPAEYAREAALETVRLARAHAEAEMAGGDGGALVMPEGEAERGVLVPFVPANLSPAPALAIEADVTDEAAVERMFAEAVAAYGRVDLLVNNAGIQEGSASHETSAESFDRVMAVNVRGAFLCARAAIRHFLERGAKGTIVNVSSVHERIPRPGFLSYAMSKFALHGMTQTLALEYADRGIRVVAVAPGATDTPIQSWYGDADGRAAVAAHVPIGRVAEPEEIARLVAFLASDAAAYVTGQTLFADGGLALYPSFQHPWSG